MHRPSEDPRPGYLVGYEIEFERRRYGHTTYTWVYGRLEDEDQKPYENWECLGDPWPCITPKRAEIHAEALRILFPTEQAARVNQQE
jgi:hypothetical protein